MSWKTRSAPTLSSGRYPSSSHTKMLGARYRRNSARSRWAALAATSRLSTSIALVYSTVTEHRSEQMGTAPLAVFFHHPGPLTEVHLQFLGRTTLHPP